MRLILNGEQTEVDFEPRTVAGVLALRQPRPPFAVEVNQRLVRRPDYERTPLAEGDRVEIVTLVGGG